MGYDSSLALGSTSDISLDHNYHIIKKARHRSTKQVWQPGIIYYGTNPEQKTAECHMLLPTCSGAII